jgi:NADPH:quinone reductase-like Zn-dependent oxidoreductase
MRAPFKGGGSEDTMRKIIHGADTPLTLAVVDRPTPGKGEVLIRVAAAGVNRPDLTQRAGFYPPPPGAPETLGLEVSGVIESVGPGVTRWHEGDEVCALLAGGGYATYAIAHEGSVLPVPKGLSLVEAAALPETVFTVWARRRSRWRRHTARACSRRRATRPK